MKIEALLNNDIIGNETAGNGRSASSRLRVLPAGPEDSLPRAVAVYANEIAERYVPSMTVDLVLRQDRFRRGGDHPPFANAIRLTTASENYAFQHTPNDTVANMSTPYTARGEDECRGGGVSRYGTHRALHDMERAIGQNEGGEAGTAVSREVGGTTRCRGGCRARARMSGKKKSMWGV